MTSITFTFEELSPRKNGRLIDGCMLYGTATLETEDEAFDKYGFIVTEIELDGGYSLSKLGDAWLWKVITDEIYAEKTAIGRAAAEAFRDAVDGDVDTMPSFKSRVYNALSAA